MDGRGEREWRGPRSWAVVPFAESDRLNSCSSRRLRGGLARTVLPRFEHQQSRVLGTLLVPRKAERRTLWTHRLGTTLGKTSPSAGTRPKPVLSTGNRCPLQPLLLGLLFVLVFFGYGFLSSRRPMPGGVGVRPSVAVGDPDGRPVVALSRMLYPQPKALTPSRSDVLVLTPWLAPIVWEGTFSPEILDEQFRLQNVTVGLTVFAVKKYVAFLQLFLETAEQHFMVGHRVTYYVFTDRPADVPRVPLREGRRLAVLAVRSHARWQDVSMHRMETISRFSEQRFRHEVDYLVCVDVDMKFRDHVGVEILSPLFGTLHPGFYRADRQAFTYERRPQSQAYIPPDEGDFYYLGGFFGGSVAEVQRLTSACHQAMVLDKANGIEAVWHDESHLNKYLLYHKPTKVLSPEYLWDQQLLGWPSVMKKLRFVAVPKNHKEMRSP
ncbi:histo-blood group ABO system transferase 2-like [Lepus europaeus]|uniref:histo-blood group ABO system transferase 2-like n=1 Tax=Lepus europaeus TaxID=9983 RepID=UPI002B47D3D0|nr:histo-blood group ABO system transferase 2-like [Lepus europaeus]